MYYIYLIYSDLISNIKFLILYKIESKMNIKCVTYSRYSTSIPIYTVIQEKGNPTIGADAEKVDIL